MTNDESLIESSTTEHLQRRIEFLEIKLEEEGYQASSLMAIELRDMISKRESKILKNK